MGGQIVKQLQSWVELSTNIFARRTTGQSTAGTLAATTVAVAGLTTLGAAIDVSNYDQIMVVVDNTDAAAIVFDAFEIQASVDGGSNFETLYSAAGDYTSPAGLLVDASGDLTVLAAAARGWFVLNCGAIDQLRIQASANTTQSVGVTGTFSGK